VVAIFGARGINAMHFEDSNCVLRDLLRWIVERSLGRPSGIMGEESLRACLASLTGSKPIGISHFLVRKFHMYFPSLT
jgi:hypothetical protein